MSFDVNVLSSKPVIKPTTQMNNDGGGGNLGYMYQGRRQKKDEGKNIFAEGEALDSFGEKKDFEIGEDIQFSFWDVVKEIFDAIKSFFAHIS